MNKAVFMAVVRLVVKMFVGVAGILLCLEARSDPHVCEMQYFLPSFVVYIMWKAFQICRLFYLLRCSGKVVILYPVKNAHPLWRIQARLERVVWVDKIEGLLLAGIREMADVIKTARCYGWEPAN
ncbi:hypothetical protein KKB83_01100 [Patescibacteria group bacterium]|nr:hypothetical protein [Patescibacteria group bacterium]